MKRIRFLRCPMHPWTMDETVREIERRLEAGLFTQHVVLNVAKLVRMHRDPELRRAVEGCDIINIDGMGVVWGARWLGHPVPERVAGIDLFFRLLEWAEVRGEPVFFLGAKEDVLQKAVTRLREQYSRLSIAGWHHGYFWDDERAVVDRIADSGATMLFVAITSPLKENFINRWRDNLGVKFAMGVGGTFDIVAGSTRRAPRFVQNMGLEWAFRLLQEPRRMAGRYFTTNFQYMVMLIRAKLRGPAY